jgi:hypothetical protein
MIPSGTFNASSFSTDGGKCFTVIAFIMVISSFSFASSSLCDAILLPWAATLAERLATSSSRLDIAEL